MSPALLTVGEGAAVLRVSIPRMYDLLKRDLVPGQVKIGRQIRIVAAKLDDFISGGGKALPGGWRKGSQN